MKITKFMCDICHEELPHVLQYEASPSPYAIDLPAIHEYEDEEGHKLLKPLLEIHKGMDVCTKCKDYMLGGNFPYREPRDGKFYFKAMS